MRREFISISLCILQIDDEKRPCILSSSLNNEVGLRGRLHFGNSTVAKNATMRMIRTIV